MESSGTLEPSLVIGDCNAFAQETQNLNSAEEGNKDRKSRILGLLNSARIIEDYHVTSKNMDKSSRKLFPLAFLVFNILFWIIYSTIPDQTYESLF